MEDAEKKQRHWIPNPTGKGLPGRKWRETDIASMKFPRSLKPSLFAVAEALDRGDITPDQLQSFLSNPQAQPQSPQIARYLTQEEYDLIESWVPHTLAAKVQAAGFEWLHHAPGVALGNKYFAIKNLAELLDWIHSPDGQAAWAAANSPTGGEEE